MRELTVQRIGKQLVKAMPSGKRFFNRHTLKVAVVLAAVYASASAFAIGPRPISGYVYSRSVVLSDNENPYWVAFDSDGKIVEQHGEATEAKALENVFILGGETYRARTEQWENILAQYPSSSPQPELKTREEFLGIQFSIAGNVVDVGPALGRDSTHVLVRPPNQVVDGSYQYFVGDISQIILMQSSFNFTEPLDAGIRSLLTNREDGATVLESNHNIGLETAFFGERGQYDSTEFNLRERDDRIWGPIRDVEIESITSKGVTGEDGKYTVYVEAFPCDLVATQMWTMIATLYSADFNPRHGSRRPYFMIKQYSPPCFADAWYAILGGLGVSTPNSFFTPEQKYMDFPIDLMVLNGYAQMHEGVTVTEERTTYKESGTSLNKEVNSDYDFDGDGVNDTAILGSMIDNPNPDPNALPEKLFRDTTVGVDDMDLVQGVYLSSIGNSYTGAEGPQPDLIRIADYTTNFSDEGLVKNLSIDDLKNTDLYIFRASTGEVIAERSGLSQSEVEKIQEIGVDDERGQFYYSMSIRGPREGLFRDTSRSLTGRFDEDGNYQSWDESYKRWQTISGMRPELHQRESDHLRPGEFVKIIAINRATGYIGSASTVLTNSTGVGDTGTHLSIQLPEIEMKPPNLKVWAERHYKIEHGLTKTQERTYTIGNEGASTKDDQWVAIHTEWLDEDDVPLPKGLGDFGFTGRVGRITGENVVSEAGGSLDPFSIKPGKHLEVIRVAGQDIANEHLYVQVSGEPKERLADFSSVNRATGAPTGPNFSSTGVHAGKLKYRPDRYVPMKVPVWDESRTIDGEKAYRAAIAANPDLRDTLVKPQPSYRWQYRPEFQFSSYSLDVTKIEERNVNEETGELESGPNILNSDSPAINPATDLLSLMYSLTQNNNAPLDLFNGEKELVFAVGETEILATFGASQELLFENLQHLGALDAVDFQTISLYLNNDGGNLLWEWQGLPGFLVVPRSLVEGNGIDKRTVESDIEDTYFFPALGNKKVFVQSTFARNYSGRVAVVSVEDNIFETVPAVGTYVDIENLNTKFLFKGGQSVIPRTADLDKKYKVTFRMLLDEYDPIEREIEVAVRTNSNTPLSELLEGKAIWYKGVLNAQATSAQKAAQKGQTSGGTPDKQFVDYGQYMMNIAAIPLIKEVKEENLKYAIVPDGDFGTNSRKMLKSFMDEESKNDIPKFDNDSYATGSVLSHFDSDTETVSTSTIFRSLRKLLQDYQPSIDVTVDNVEDEKSIDNVPTLDFEEYRYAVMTPEAMRGLEYVEAEGRTIANSGDFTDVDLGLYEMYLSYDWDGDGLSNLAEVENSLNGNYQSNLFSPLSSENNTSTDYDDRLLTAYNRGGWGRTVAIANDIYTPTGSGLAMGEISGTDGRDIAGLRIPTFAPGMYDLGGSEKNRDSYTTLPMVSLLEAVGRAWSKAYPDTAPLETDPTTHATVIGVREGQLRMGINDISSAAGGFNKAPYLNIVRKGRTISQTNLGHNTHHNGLDIDMRFVANIEVERPIDLKNNRALFDLVATAQLLTNIAAEAARFGLVPRAMFAGENGTQLTPDDLRFLCLSIGLFTNCSNQAGHNNHIHLSFSNGLSQRIKPPANAVESIEITYMDGGENAYSYSEVLIDLNNNALLPWHQIWFTPTARNADDEEVIQVQSLHPNLAEQNNLWVNDQNQQDFIGQVRLKIKCMKADNAVYPIQLKNALNGNTLIKTLNVTCQVPTGN